MDWWTGGTGVWDRKEEPLHALLSMSLFLCFTTFSGKTEGQEEGDWKDKEGRRRRQGQEGRQKEAVSPGGEREEYLSVSEASSVQVTHGPLLYSAAHCATGILLPTAKLHVLLEDSLPSFSLFCCCVFMCGEAFL